MSASSSDVLPFGPVMPAGRSVADPRALRAELNRAAERLCPPWLRPSVDDIVHEAYLRVVRAAARGDEAQRRGYLWKVVYTTMIDWMRREGVRQRGRDLEVAVDSVAVDATSPEVKADARQIGAHIHDCVDRLPAARKPIVALYLQGHGATEIARLLGDAYKTVENLLYRGLAQVRACLQRKGVTP